MSRHQANREARRLLREAGLRVLDPTDPEEPANVELREALHVAARGHAQRRAQTPTRWDYDVWAWARSH